MIIGGEARRAGQRAVKRMDVGSERLVESRGFGSKQDNGRKRGNGRELPWCPVIGYQQRGSVKQSDDMPHRVGISAEIHAVRRLTLSDDRFPDGSVLWEPDKRYCVAIS